MTRWLVVIATGRYADENLPDLKDIGSEITDVLAVFAALGYPESRQRVLLNEKAADIRERLGAFLAERGPDDAVAIYITGHGEVWDSPAGARLRLHTTESRWGLLPGTLDIAALLEGLAGGDATERLRNLLLVIDVCGAGAGLGAAIEDFRTYLQPLHLEADAGAGAYAVATARAADLATVSSFARPLRALIEAADIAPRAQAYLELGPLVQRVRASLEDQVVETVVTGQSGPNLCLPNPRHHLGGVDWREMEEWWEPRARGAVPGRARWDQESQWRFTGRVDVNRRLTAWLADPQDVPLLVLTAAPGSGKSTVVARTVALTVPDFRRAYTAASRDPQETVPADTVVFRAAVWARAASVDKVRERITRALGLESWTDLATLAAPRDGAPPVIALDALDEAEEPVQLVRQVLRPLTFAAVRGAVRLLVATRPHPARGDRGEEDLITPLTSAGKHLLIELDKAAWLSPGDIADYVELLLTEPPSANRRSVYSGAEAARQRRRLARSIERRARHSFLLAALVARRHSRDLTPADPRSRRWLRQFPRDIGEALKADLEAAYGHDSERVYDLLRPLGHALGAGLTREVAGAGEQDLWAALATELGDGGERFGAADIDRLLRDRAGTYLIASTDAGGSVAYRFHHEALAEHFAPAERRVEDHRRITETLLGLLPLRDGYPDWWRVCGYTTRSLPEHARQAGVLADLLGGGRNAHMIVVCDPAAVHAALGGTDRPELLAIRDMLRSQLHRLTTMPPEERAKVLAALALASPRTRALGHALVPAGTRPRTAVAAIHPAGEYLVLSPLTPPEQGWPMAACAEQDGQRLFATGEGPFVQLWNPQTGTPVDLLSEHGGAVKILRSFLDSDGFPALAVADDTGKITVWDLGLRYRPRYELTLRAVYELVAGRSAEGRAFLAGRDLCGVWTWFPGGEDEVRYLDTDEGLITGLTIVSPPSGDLLVVAGDSHVQFWEPGNREAGAAHQMPDTGIVTLTGAGEWAVAAENPRGHRFWLLRPTGEEPAELSVPGRESTFALCVEYVRGQRGSLIATGYSDGTVALWPNADREPPVLLQSSGPSIRLTAAANATATSTALLAVADADNNVHVWDVDRQRFWTTLSSPEPITDLVLGRYRDGGAYAAVQTDSSVHVWPVAETEHVNTPDLHRGRVTDLAWTRTREGLVVATAGTEGTIRIWDEDGSGRTALPSGSRPDDTARLNMYQARDRIHVVHTNEHGGQDFDLSTGPYPLRILNEDVTDSALVSLPDGRAVLGLLIGSQVRLLEAESGRVVTELPGDEQRLYRLGLGTATDGRLLVAAGGGWGVTWLWTVHPDTGEAAGHRLSGNRGEVTSVRFGRAASRDYLLTGCRAGKVNRWEIDQPGSPFALFDRPGARVIDLACVTGEDGLHGYVTVSYVPTGSDGDIAVRCLTTGEAIPIVPESAEGPVSVLSSSAPGAAVARVCSVRGEAVDILRMTPDVVHRARWPLPVAPTVVRLAGDRLLLAGAGGFLALDL
ncbi:hypothetical protein [Streptosporangium sp. NPDC002721]|uniref:hypothetical protein n=1 Tax=Streptosporangium sp. NPDC002721 TaxID=3366188 RepID=UPI0036822C13